MRSSWDKAGSVGQRVSSPVSRPALPSPPSNSCAANSRLRIFYVFAARTFVMTKLLGRCRSTPFRNDEQRIRSSCTTPALVIASSFLVMTK